MFFFTLSLRPHRSHEPTCVVDGVVGLSKVCQLFRSGADQHVVHEKGMVGPARNHSDPHLLRHVYLFLVLSFSQLDGHRFID